MLSGLLSSVAPSARAPSGMRLRNATLENPIYSLDDPAVYEMFGATPSASGQVVSPHRALHLGSVWQAVSTISGDMASMPFNRYKRTSDDDRELDRSHNVQYLIATQPNDEMSPFDLWRRLFIHALIWGNGYLYIERRSRYSDPLSLINLLPDRTEPVRRPNGELGYVTEVDGRMEPLFKEEVFHLKGISLDNSCGHRLIAAAREAIGLALARQSFESKFFANGSHMSGVLEVPASMTAKAAGNLEEGFSKRVNTSAGWFKVAILRDGAKFQSTMVSPEQAQLVEARTEDSREIARYFNMPGFKLGLQDSVSYNSSEMAQRIYLTTCLLHWMSATAGEAHLKLLTPQEKRDDAIYFEHNASVLIESDVKTLNEVLEIQRRNEIINANEWRRKINLNKRTDPGGETYVNPNTKPAPGAGGDKPPSEPAGTPPKKPKPSKATADAHRLLLIDTLDRMGRRVGLSARKAAKVPEKFLALVDTGAAEHRPAFSEAVAPILVAHASVADMDANGLYQRVEGEFFGALSESLTALSTLTASQDVFQQSVDSSMDSFEKLTGQRVAGLVIGGCDERE